MNTPPKISRSGFGYSASSNIKNSNTPQKRSNFFTSYNNSSYDNLLDDGEHAGGGPDDDELKSMVSLVKIKMFPLSTKILDIMRSIFVLYQNYFVYGVSDISTWCIKCIKDIDTIYNEYKEVPGEKFASEAITIKPKKIFYYKDFSISNYRVYSEKNNNEIYVSDNLPTYEWKLENESKIISGYNCKKATTTKNILNKSQYITAWYCDDISINDGPMDFNGLPGFIIQIEIDDKTILKFEKIALNYWDRSCIEKHKAQIKKINPTFFVTAYLFKYGNNIS